MIEILLTFFLGTVVGAFLTAVFRFLSPVLAEQLKSAQKIVIKLQPFTKKLVSLIHELVGAEEETRENCLNRIVTTMDDITRCWSEVGGHEYIIKGVNPELYDQISSIITLNRGFAQDSETWKVIIVGKTRRYQDVFLRLHSEIERIIAHPESFWKLIITNLFKRRKVKPKLMDF